MVMSVCEQMKDFWQKSFAMDIYVLTPGLDFLWVAFYTSYCHFLAWSMA